MTKIACVSDVHGRNVKVPNADILVISGDLTERGTLPQIGSFNEWLGTLPHKIKLLTAGNHDFGFERNSDLAKSLITNGIYLENESITVDGIKFWLSPVTPWFFNWAFNVERGAKIKRYWDMIPDDVQVLVTHGPSHMTLDRCADGFHAGCEELAVAIQRVNPLLHICGHIHEAAGIDGPYEKVGDGYRRNRASGTVTINASSIDLRYEPNGNQWIFEI